MCLKFENPDGFVGPFGKIAIDAYTTNKWIKNEANNSKENLKMHRKGKVFSLLFDLQIIYMVIMQKLMIKLVLLHILEYGEKRY